MAENRPVAAPTENAQLSRFAKFQMADAIDASITEGLKTKRRRNRVRILNNETAKKKS